MRRLESEAKEVTTILTNILIFIIATIVFARTSSQTHEIYKLPGLLMPSILSAASLIFTNVSSIAYMCTEYRAAEELFANEGKEDYGMICFLFLNYLHLHKLLRRLPARRAACLSQTDRQCF